MARELALRHDDHRPGGRGSERRPGHRPLGGAERHPGAVAGRPGGRRRRGHRHRHYYIRTFDAPPCSGSAARNRWGDYSGTALDPFDECFWVYNQYAISRGTNTTGGCNGRPAVEDGRWGTAYAYFCESCPTNVALSSLTVSGTESHEARDVLTASTVTVQATGDLTLTSADVGLLAGFSVASGGQLTIVNGPCP